MCTDFRMRGIPSEFEDRDPPIGLPGRQLPFLSANECRIDLAVLDVAFPFAKALMSRATWKLWTPSTGQIADGASTEEGLAALELAFAKGAAARFRTLNLAASRIQYVRTQGTPEEL